jgi:anaerobic magnesium-protoporphyrin IX monomethyl ester cyclase
MDILLTHGYFLYEDPHERQVMKPYPPLGLLYISSYLKQQGFNVGVFDTTFRDLFAFETYLQEHRPSVVGLYTNMMTKRRILQMIRLCKVVNATVILGGPDPAYYAAEYLQHGADIIVRGEGEMTLEELLPHLAKHGLNQLESIAGIVYRDGTGSIHETPPRVFIGDLSANPWPDREAIDLPEYLRIWKAHHGRSSVSVIQARGCPYTCTWCSHSVFGHTHRRRAPDDAAREVLWIKERYNPDLVWYADDVFGINARWLHEYAARLKHYGIKIPFECISRADRLTEPVIQTLVEMGCYRLWNGSESGSQNILDAMQRKVTAADVQKKTHLLQQHGIETGMFIMLGYKGETMTDLVETVEHLKRCNPDIFLTTVAYPIKGTPYYAEVETDILRAGDWAENGDRDLTVAGRYSKRFYSFATRWMVSEVALNRARTKGGVSWRRKAKLWLSTRVGWYGMKLTQNGKEQATERLKPITINANVSMPHSS